MTKKNDVKMRTVADQIKAIMIKMADKPMSETCAAIVKGVVTVKAPVNMARARAYYTTFVRENEAPGRVERTLKPTSAKLKPVKAPVVKTPKAPVDRVEQLKAAAKKAGIHKESAKVKKLESDKDQDDVLDLAAPSKLSLADLKNVL